jgi:argininosuccinate lyase
VLGESLFAHVDREAVERALDPAESVAARDSYGGPSPEAVAGALGRAESGLAADRGRVAERRDRAAAAAADLAEVVAGYA